MVIIVWSCLNIGATVPDYVVTADDVDTYLSVDCIPMDESGRQVTY